jgi:hypothetical protein
MSGGNDRAQRQAQQAEDQRRANIAAASQSVNNIFSSPERQAQYADVYDATRTLGMSDLDRQKAQADRQTTFALARSGLTGGSRAIDVGRTLGEDYINGLLTVDQKAQAAKADFMSADQQAKNNLLGLVQSGLDITTANQNATSALRSNLEGARATGLVGGIGEVFGTAADVYQRGEDERIRRQATEQYGQTAYSPFWSFGGGR